MLCTTLPPLPGLSTRIGVFVLLGWSCFAIDAASAACSLLASWSETWMPVPELDPADCVCVASWSAEFRLLALASLSTVLDCRTFPSLPGLSTRIDAFVFEAPFCSAFEPASAACSFFASWSDVWIPVEPAQ